MNFNEMVAAVDEAKRTLHAAESQTNAMARLIVGHLKSVNGSTLEDLKRELRGFNIQTHRWSRKG